MDRNPTLTAFYHSSEWRKCRTNYKKDRCYICERCGATTKKMIVHHKIHLTPDLVLDPSVSLSYDNLELLCMDCHNKEHFKKESQRRYAVDEFGTVHPLID